MLHYHGPFKFISMVTIVVIYTHTYTHILMYFNTVIMLLFMFTDNLYPQSYKQHICQSKTKMMDRSRYFTGKRKVIHLISTIKAHEAYSKENLVACWMGSQKCYHKFSQLLHQNTQFQQKQKNFCKISIPKQNTTLILFHFQHIHWHGNRYHYVLQQKYLGH